MKPESYTANSSELTSLWSLVSLHSSHIHAPSAMAVSVQTPNPSPQALDDIVTDSETMKGMA